VLRSALAALDVSNASKRNIIILIWDVNMNASIFYLDYLKRRLEGSDQGMREEKPAKLKRCAEP